MSDPAEVSIDAALLRSLGQIQIVNGYQTDIGLHVRGWEFNPETDLAGIADFVPYLIWIDEGETNERSTEEPAWTYDLTVLILVFADASPDLADARGRAWRIIQDVEQLLAADRTLDGTALRSRVASKSVSRRAAGSNYVTAACQVAVDYYNPNAAYLINP